MFKDKVIFAIRTFKSRKLRSFLTMIGVFIGIAAIVGLISLGQGLKETVNEQFRSLGTDKIIIMPGSSLMSVTTASAKLYDKDVETILKVQGIKDLALFKYRSDKVTFNGKSIYSVITGVPTEKGIKILTESLGTDIVEGRMLQKGETSKVVVGWKFANDDKMFGRKVQIGDKIEIQNKKFEVVGVFESRGNDADDLSIYIPLSAYENLYDQEYIDMIYAQTISGVDNLAVAEKIKKELRNSRGLEEGEEDFTVQTLDQLLESFGTILNILNIILLAITSISLVVGGIGIMNTMYTSVLERRKEIGIMKSIGAKNSDIMHIFLIEAALLGFIGGVIGILLGVIMGKTIEWFTVNVIKFALIRVVFPPTLIFGALLFAIITGIISGVLPAIRASRLNPVEALRK